MLIALATNVGDPLSAEKREVTLNPASHRAAREVAIFLIVVLTIADIGAECFD